MADILTAKHVTFAYNKKSPVVLQDVSVHVATGDVVALLGPNGSGKSTLLNLLCGILRPSQGDVLLNGQNICRYSAREIAQTIAYVPQRVNLSFDYSVFDYVLMGRTAHTGMLSAPTKEDFRVTEVALERMELTRFRYRSIRELSGGEQQKACIARALTQQPRLIVLDEPTSALDYGNQVKVLQLISQLQNDRYAVLITTHTPDHPLLLDCTTWLLNKAGHLSCGTARDTITTATMRCLYGDNVTVTHVPLIDRPTCLIDIHRY